MEIGRQLARMLIQLWPTEAGLWRVMRYAPIFPPDSDPVTVQLRGLPLRLTVKPQTYLGRFAYYRGTYEEGCLRLLRRLLRPGMTFVDVGANVGIYSVVAGHAVGAKGKVLAVEPQADVSVMLAANAKLNGLSNITTKTVALGETCGTGLLHQLSPTNTGQASLQVCDGDVCFGECSAVRVTTLSQLMTECGMVSVDGLKIDVEGAELSVLRGFADWLNDRPPAFIFLECIDAHLRRFNATSQDVMLFLRGFGYRLHCLYRGKWRPIERSCDHSRFGYSPDLVATRDALRS
jgi:FkbM family methyltransferase